MVNVTSEWGRLREAVTGDASAMFVYPPGSAVAPGALPIHMRLLDMYLCRFLAGKAVPEWIRRGFARESERLAAFLRTQDVVVRRVSPSRPFPGESPGMTQVFARDPVIVAGDTVIIGRHRQEALRKEIRGYEPLLQALKAGGVRVVGPPPEGAFVEGGDVIVALPYVFVGIGSRATNRQGAAWLAEMLGSRAQIVEVALRDPLAFHLDTCFVPIGAALAVAHAAALHSPLPALLNSFELIDPGRRCYAQTGVNVLALAPDTVLIQRRHRPLKLALESHGLTVRTLPFFWHALAGGGFRCATQILHRE